MEKMQNGDGEWVTDKEELKKVVVDYFRRIFSDKETDIRSLQLHKPFPALTEDEIITMGSQVGDDEIKRAVFNIEAFKDPGVDGYPGLFLHTCLGLCSEDVYKLIKKVFNTGSIPDGLNDTLITLIPKTKCPISMNKMRPLSLCNTLYKIIVSRLRVILSPNQVSFVPGRKITDNISIAQKVVQRYKRA